MMSVMMKLFCTKIHCQKTFFDDGNFQIEDGLIVLVEKKPIQKKLDFMSKVLPKCSSKCNEMKEFKPRAA